MPTPHLEFNKEDISNIVLMTGDPLRSKFIADTYLTDVKLINDVRNMLGFTGYYKGKRITIIGSGMGIPSMGIYSYELYKFYNVDYIIRVGSCGSYNKDLNVFDLILVNNSYSESEYKLDDNTNKLVPSSISLTNIIEDTAKNKGIKITRGNIHTNEVFYNNDNMNDAVNNYGCLGVEMEAYSLFINALYFNKEAACILTVSDSLITKESVSIEEREKSFTRMIELALDSTLNI